MTGDTLPTFERLDGALHLELCDLSHCKRYTVFWAGVPGGGVFEAYFGKVTPLALVGPTEATWDSERGKEIRRSLYRKCVAHARKTAKVAA